MFPEDSNELSLYEMLSRLVRACQQITDNQAEHSRLLSEMQALISDVEAQGFPLDAGALEALMRRTKQKRPPQAVRRTALDLERLA